MCKVTVLYYVHPDVLTLIELYLRYLLINLIPSPILISVDCQPDSLELPGRQESSHLSEGTILI